MSDSSTPTAFDLDALKIAGQVANGHARLFVRGLPVLQHDGMAANVAGYLGVMITDGGLKVTMVELYENRNPETRGTSTLLVVLEYDKRHVLNASVPPTVLALVRAWMAQTGHLYFQP